MELVIINFIQEYGFAVAGFIVALGVALFMRFVISPKIKKIKFEEKRIKEDLSKRAIEHVRMDKKPLC